MRTPLLAKAIALLLLVPPAEARAQATTLDEGAFRVTIGGTEAGSESFAIRRTQVGSEVQVYATAEIDLRVPDGRLDLRPALRLEGGEMAVTGYQVKISGQQQQEIFLELGDNRFVTRVHSERGEQQREYRAAPGTLLLDTGVAHQYYFLAARLPSGGGTIPVMVPREGRQFELRVTDLGTSGLSIGGRSVEARHLRLEGNQELRELWVDGSGRVLRLDHPASGYSAIRTNLP